MGRKWKSKEQLTDLLCDLVAIPSVSGSAAERELPYFVRAGLAKLPYFERNPEHLRLHPTGDGRHFVTALAKRTEDTRDTIIVLSHYDVVDVKDYGTWEALAFDPRKLTAKFYAEKASLPKAVQADLDQGDWLFGRGAMDMKCGLALHMSMLERACLGEFDGNVLLLTVPDEEVNSVGMRAAVPALLEMAERYGLDYKAVVNSEPVFSRHPGDLANYVYTGTIGKVLPGFLCYGKETHVGEPLSGLNGNYMASMLTCEFELNADFCEFVDGESTPPPTNQLQRDLKQDYSVQIPHRAVTLFNLFVLERSMEELVERLLQAASRAVRRMEEAYASAVAATKARGVDMNVAVLTFEQLLRRAEQAHGKAVVERLLRQTRERLAGRDDREVTIALVDEVSILCKELAPMTVLFFAPPYYPAVSSRNDAFIRRAVDDLTALARDRYGVELERQHFFGGISDLSYVGTGKPASSLELLVSNMPLWGEEYSLPLAELERFAVPVLNVAPIGRDAHQRTERLDVDYSFGTLPEMLYACLQNLFATSRGEAQKEAEEKVENEEDRHEKTSR